MIFEKIRAIISSQFDVDEEKITAATSFAEDLDADSLDVVELMMSMEEKFGIEEIPEDEIKTIETVGQLVDFVTNAMN